MRHDRLAKKLATHVSGAEEQWPSIYDLAERNELERYVF